MTSLVDAIHSVLLPYYPDGWARERANSLAQACGEPDVRLRDIELMLRKSGDRPEPMHVRMSVGHSVAPLSDHQRCQLAGNVLAAAMSQANRRLRLEAL